MSGQIFPPDVIRSDAPATDPGVVLICEHASAHFPKAFGSLGLSSSERLAHIAWDPGALGVAKELRRVLSGDLVAGTVSRLIYDCNRPPEAESAFPEHSEIFDIPGNIGLTETEKAARTAAIYDPFCAAVRQVMANRPSGILITVHSFTPVFKGKRRHCEIGILHDADYRLADLLLRDWPKASPHKAERNVPYGPEDGVTHTLKLHGLTSGWPHVMLEIRNDLIVTTEQQIAMARLIADRIELAIQHLKETAHD